MARKSNSNQSDYKTRVFISWSRSPSKKIAESLKYFVSNVFQDVDLFLSTNDIDAGANWFGEISEALALSNYGVLCLAENNLDSKWLHFEAGALAKQITEKSRVVPYLFKLKASELSPPLNMFNGVEANRDGTFKLLESLNCARQEQFERQQLLDIFDKWWPDYEKQLKEAYAIAEGDSVVKRPDREVLDELLAVVKSIKAHSPQRNDVIPKGELFNLRVQLSTKIADLKFKMLELKRQQNFDYGQEFEVLNDIQREYGLLKYM